MQQCQYILAISHEDVLSRVPQSSLRIPHDTGCGCKNTIFQQKISNKVEHLNYINFLT